MVAAYTIIVSATPHHGGGGIPMLLGNTHGQVRRHDLPHTGMLPQAIDYRLLLGYLRDNLQVVIG